jgi:3,4-dehydroadipyl-CoA semialdehyde dehydrogenase
MIELQSYLLGAWHGGTASGDNLVDPVKGTNLAHTSSTGLDLAAALEYSRRVGVPSLQQMSYKDRAGLLSKIAAVLSANRDEYLRISLENSGSSPADASIDIDGSIFTLKYFARVGSSLTADRYLLDGAVESLSKDGSFQAQHFLFPLKGVAILINAFNFPAWGLWEKAAPALLSGVPIFAKPATATVWLTNQMVSDVIAANILPPGSLSLLCGGARELLDHVQSNDVVSFTGSAQTAERIRTNGSVTRHSTRINIEADSLNCAVLGPEARPGTAEFDLFVREVVREMTVKTGQKCTAIRRAIVPAAVLQEVADAISARLTQLTVGDPRNPEVRMGPVVNKIQQRHALEGISLLQSEARVVCGASPDFAPLDADPRVSCFVQPTLFACASPLSANHVHTVEVFGPVATLLPYGDVQEAFDLARLSGGSLVGSIFSADDEFSAQAIRELAHSHGRILSVNESVGQSQTGHGNVMPMCLHGGPGRAGAGEELGGLRALSFYHRRAVVQSSLGLLNAFASHGAESRARES